MKKLLLFAAMLIPLSAFADIFINEIDYDQPGTDAAEFVELAGTAGTYTNVEVVFINGNGNSVYETFDLGSITLTDEADGYGFYVLGASGVPNTDYTISASIQNGSPDGIQLSVGGTIVDAVSYEGSMNDTNGDPMEVATPDDSDPYYEGAEGMSIGRLGLDGYPWAVMNNSPGAINEGQSLVEGLPIVENVNYTPQPPNETESVTVTADATDSNGSITSVNLYVAVDGGDYTSQSMSNTTGSTYEATISANPVGTVVSFYVEATDNEANVTESTVFEYTVMSSTGYSIADIQTTSEPGSGDDCYPSPFDGQVVSISGVVTAVDEGAKYIQDSTSPWSGMKIFDYNVSFAVGDSISITGTIDEYFGMTEILDITEDQIHSSDNLLPEPVEVTTGTLGGGCSAEGEPYEGMLVVLNNVTVTQTADDNGQWFVDDGSGECEIEDSIFPYEPTVGEEFDQIIGVVDYGYGEYAVIPRGESDLIQDANAPEITGVTSAPEFITSNNEIEVRADIAALTGTISTVIVEYGSGGNFPNSADMFLESGNEYVGFIPAQAGNSEIQFRISAEDSEGNVSQSVPQNLLIANTTPMDISELRNNFETYADQVVTVSGIITIGSGVLVDSRTQAYVQDASGRGVQLFHPDLIEGIHRGDEVTAVGYAIEYQQTLEVSEFNYRVESTDNDLPTVQELTIAEANDLMWEGTLIEISAGLSDKWWAGGGTNLEFADGNDTTIVRVWDITGIDTTDFVVGESYWVRGVGGVYAGDAQLLLGYETDYGSGVGIDAEDSGQPLEFALGDAYPNPFNPATTISWQLPQAGQHELAVFNILGQKIQVLSSGHTTAGKHLTRWEAGDQPSGIYFIQLTSQGQTQVQKVTLLR